MHRHRQADKHVHKDINEQMQTLDDTDAQKHEFKGQKKENINITIKHLKRVYFFIIIGININSRWEECNTKSNVL